MSTNHLELNPIHHKERRFVDREYALIFIACNPEKKESGGMAVCLLMVRTFAIGVVVARVLAVYGNPNMLQRLMK